MFETRGVTPWRIFLTLYEQLGGSPIIEGGGTRIGMDDDVAIRALEWMTEPNKRGIGGPDVDYQGSVAFFGNGTAAFALNGEWEVTTYQAITARSTRSRWRSQSSARCRCWSRSSSSSARSCRGSRTPVSRGRPGWGCGDVRPRVERTKVRVTD